MSVRNEQENLEPETQSSSPSNCMVVKGGTIPASLPSFPGMEDDQLGFNGLSQDISPNGISQFVENPNTFAVDREMEVEAASEPHSKPPPIDVLTASTLNAEVDSSAVIEPAAATTKVSTNQTLPPLHININDCSKSESREVASETSNNGAGNLKTEFQKPTIRIPQRPSTSSSVPTSIVMGPPSSTNTQVLLSPAGNLYNGFPRKSSGDSSPVFGNRAPPKGNRTPHPLAAQRSTSSNRPTSTTGQASRPPSSLTSPSPTSGIRKDHELSRRRALVDRVSKSRGPQHSHLLHQVEQLSHTQMSILIRKNRSTLVTEGMPYSVQKVIDCGSDPDKTEQMFKEKIREANAKRSRHTNMDELTDVSDLEDDLDSNIHSQERHSPRTAPRWIPKRMRYAGLLSRTETLLDEKTALLGMLKNQNTVMNSSSGVRFLGEDMQPRRRRQLNGMLYLYDKTNFRRANPSQFGCSRAMPIQSWTKREVMHRDLFDESANTKSQSPGSALVKPGTSPNDRWIATASHNCVTKLTVGDKREVTEYDYEEYKAGEVMQQVNQLSSMDPMDFIFSSDYNTLEDRQMAYMHRISTAPFNAIRKKHGKSIHYENDYRKTSDSDAVVKRKTDKKKERKPVGEASDEERQKEDEELRTVTKRPRGRPSSSRRKSSRMIRDPGDYVDYLFDDSHDDVCMKQLPNKVTYASITVPIWYKIPDDYWNDVPNSNSAADDLLISNAKQHHKLMHAERERIRLETNRRPRNRKDKSSAAATPAHNPFSEDADMEGVPPFDMSQFEPGNITSRRLYQSVERPWELRDFLNNSNPT